jgi:branched-chain amino acid transport system ATP-binding protein
VIHVVRLETKDLVAGYGKLRILNGINLKVHSGCITSVLGPNGSGKSTLMKALIGLVSVWNGEIFFGGEDISRLPTHSIIRKGIAALPQGGGVFPELSVRENLLMGAYVLDSHPETVRRLRSVYERFPILKTRDQQRAAQLSGGLQVLLSFGRALMSMPKIMLLDEPSAGLAPLIATEIFELVKRLNASGVDILIVEQKVREALRISDYAFIIVQGENRFFGSPKELQDEEKLMRTYLGVGQ